MMLTKEAVESLMIEVIGQEQLDILKKHPLEIERLTNIISSLIAIQTIKKKRKSHFGCHLQPRSPTQNICYFMVNI